MMYEKIITGTPLFSELSKDVTTKLCLSLQPYPAMRGDVIMRECEPGAEMFLVVEGEVSISRQGTVLGSLCDGSFFGETAILDAYGSVRKRTRLGKSVFGGRKPISAAAKPADTPTPVELVCRTH